VALRDELSPLGRYIRSWQKRHGDMPQKELAARADVDPGWLSNAMRGKHVPKRGNIAKLARALGDVSEDELARIAAGEEEEAGGHANRLHGPSPATRIISEAAARYARVVENSRATPAQKERLARLAADDLSRLAEVERLLTGEEPALPVEDEQAG
jgi:transcriptional regulator with XRE-family HTH domain